jgi:hypothetical protein|tara:strand:- start:264 stop:566 length:303 start_codon:yes stop_codon:yes gene_type:complete
MEDIEIRKGVHELEHEDTVLSIEKTHDNPCGVTRYDVVMDKLEGESVLDMFKRSNLSVTILGEVGGGDNGNNVLVSVDNPQSNKSYHLQLMTKDSWLYED